MSGSTTSSSPTAPPRSSSTTSRPISAAGPIGPPPAGTDVPTNGWERRTEEFKEGGVVATDDTLYTGFGFEGINESARNEFMKRTLTHLGVLAAPTPPPTTSTGTVDVGGTVEPTPTPRRRRRRGATGQVSGANAKSKRASAKIKSSRTLKVSRKGAVSVRVNCAGDAGAVCRGTVKLVRGKATYGSKAFAIKAGKTATVKVTLRKSARKASQGDRARLRQGQLRHRAARAAVGEAEVARRTGPRT